MPNRKYTCRFADNGCTKCIYNKKRIMKHQLTCQFRDMTCPTVDPAVVGDLESRLLKLEMETKICVSDTKKMETLTNKYAKRMEKKLEQINDHNALLRAQQKFYEKSMKRLQRKMQSQYDYAVKIFSRQISILSRFIKILKK